MFRSLAFVSILSATLVSGQAFAGVTPAVDDQSETLSTANVDFNDPSQVATLYKRLKYAAARVCVDARDNNSCRRYAMSDALSQIRQPQLTELATRSTAPRQEAKRYAAVTPAPQTNGTR